MVSIRAFIQNNLTVVANVEERTVALMRQINGIVGIVV